ncbi:MAG: holin family protein [Alphaproteobacteria bacterium]|nr:holin family protein [Alphaproteobacteria bacterium]
MIGSLLSQAGLPVLVAILAGALGVLEHPAAQKASAALGKVQEVLRDGGISPEQLAEANRHTEKMAELEMAQYEAALSEVNKSLRAEIISQDIYVRRMRPTFGYLVALTWAAQMFGIAYVIIFDTDKAGVVMAAMGNLSAIWAVGLSVLGIYVYRRSDDKKAASMMRDVIFWNPEEEKSLPDNP